MLKTSSTKSVEPRKGGVRVGGDNKAGYDENELDKSGMDNVEVDDSKVGDNEFRKKGQKTFKSKNLSKSKKTIGLDILIPKTRLTFIELKQEFVKPPIL